MTDSAQDFRNVEKALDLLRAYRADLTVPVQQNPAFGEALRRFGTGDTPAKIGAKLGELAQGQVVLANLLVEAIATNSGVAGDEVMQMYEDQTRALIAQLEQE
jgi:hypothetical protein